MPFPQPFSLPLPGYTLAQFRAAVGDVTQDMVTGGVTSATADTLTDTNNLGQVNNWWHHGTVSLTKGTGAKQTRTITASTEATAQLAITPNWTPTPDTTTTYEAHRIWPLATKNKAINYALRLAHPRIRILREWTTTTVLSTYGYTLPGDVRRVVKVEIEWIPSQSTYPYREVFGWHLRPDGPALFLQLPLPVLPQSRTLRVTYEAKEDTLQVDNDWADVPIDYVAYKAAAWLCRTRAVTMPERDRGEWLKLAREYDAQAGEHLGHFAQRPEPGRVLSPGDRPERNIRGGYEDLAGQHSP